MVAPPLVIRLMNYSLLWLALTATWLILSARFSPFFVMCGLATATIATIILFFLNHTLQRPLKHQLRWLIIPYLPWLLKEILLSAWDVTKRIWQINPQFNPAIGWIPAGQISETGLTIFANSITLTPGTVSLYVEPGKIFVHSLTASSFASLVDGAMNRKIIRSGG